MQDVRVLFMFLLVYFAWALACFTYRDIFCFLFKYKISEFIVLVSYVFISVQLNIY